eukprot:TRINITY_DN8062_c0_g1_i1.p1 TRINITY_DN8062_c0_g1~~TRINITY_DN8062_c0_g1_i1.p1  ORF type:complete len:495 (+),score=114.56 TRINITY_DN8062_c0_g1_i1:93-1577(+)
MADYDDITHDFMSMLLGNALESHMSEELEESDCCMADSVFLEVPPSEAPKVDAAEVSRRQLRPVAPLVPRSARPLDRKRRNVPIQSRCQLRGRPAPAALTDIATCGMSNSTEAKSLPRPPAPKAASRPSTCLATDAASPVEEVKLEEPTVESCSTENVFFDYMVKLMDGALSGAARDFDAPRELLDLFAAPLESEEAVAEKEEEQAVVRLPSAKDLKASSKPKLPARSDPRRLAPRIAPPAPEELPVDCLQSLPVAAATAPAPRLASARPQPLCMVSLDEQCEVAPEAPPVPRASSRPSSQEPPHELMASSRTPRAPATPRTAQGSSSRRLVLKSRPSPAASEVPMPLTARTSKAAPVADPRPPPLSARQCKAPTPSSLGPLRTPRDASPRQVSAMAMDLGDEGSVRSPVPTSQRASSERPQAEHYRPVSYTVGTDIAFTFTSKAAGFLPPLASLSGKTAAGRSASAGADAKWRLGLEPDFLSPRPGWRQNVGH